jgi:uncharacterized protein (TIGR04255 family)
MPNGPKYPNQQLRSVSLEVYFPGQLRVYAVLGDVQAAIAATLPNLFVPNLQAGEAAALRPFQMRDSEQRRSLAVAVNQATFVSFDYPGYETFSAEAVSVLSTALDLIKPDRLNRVAYRYENEVGIARDDEGAFLLDPTFPGIVPGVFAGSPARAINSAVEHRWERDGIKGVRGFHARVDDERGVTVLKLTVFGSVEGVPASDLPWATSEAHRVGLELFESLISNKFREFISSSKKEED